MDELKKKWQEEILSRLLIVHILIILVVGAIFMRLVYIQFFDTQTQKNSEAVHRSLISKRTLYATRGEILSRDLTPLATSILQRRVFFDFASQGFDNTEKFNEQADSLSKLLSSYFGTHPAKWYLRNMKRGRDTAIVRHLVGYDTVRYSKGFIEELLGIENCDSLVPKYAIERHHTYTKLFRDIDGNEWETLRRFPILNESMGRVYLTEFHDSRVYPHGNLALRTIGRTDVKNPYGIEYAYRDTLAGKNGYEYRQYMAPNFYAEFEDKEHRKVEPINGADIVTTLDMELQDIADRALRDVLKKQDAIWGTTVVMECQTGDILAMVNLSRNSQGGYVEGPNHAIGTPLEPGSTLKLATALILLEDAGMSPNKKYHSGLGKKVKVGKYNTIQDSHAIGKKTGGKIDLKTAFAESANVYFAKAVHDHYAGKESRYYDALCRLHLNHHVALEEFSLKSPHMPTPKSDNWYGPTLCNLAYGYGLEITPMQTLTLYNAIANNGKMVAPRLITAIKRGKKVVAKYDVKVVEDSICSKQTLALLREYLEEVALRGTAKKSFGEDKTPFRVGAKTGTATIAQGSKYADGFHLGSMVTYLPADNPRYTFITAVYKRKGSGSVFGADLAGPVQKSVASFLHNREKRYFNKASRESVHLPTDIKGGSIENIAKVAGRFNMATTYNSPTGWGNTYTGLNSVTITPIQNESKYVPDVCGMGLSDAIYLLESRGAKVKFSGAGKVVYQSKRAGETLVEGEKIEIKLE